MGDDVRWVGNENGMGRETEWSVTPLYPEISESIRIENERLKISATAEDLGSRELITEAKTLYWYPSEVDVSIRPGWFYHAEEDDQVKSLSQLVDIYFQSVGMNSVLLLNVPPDRRGRIHETDVAVLRQFDNYLSSLFENELLTDGEIEWRARTGDSREYMVRKGETINTVMLQEDISKGQRVESFRVEGWIEEEWITLAEGTTIGYKRLLRFGDVAPERIKVTIQGTRDIANIIKVGAYDASPLKDNHKEFRLNEEPI